MSFDLKLVNGNLEIGSNGDLATVSNTNKLIQDVLKMILTSVGANKMHIWYGSNFGRSIIGTPLDLEFSKEIAVSQLISSVETLKMIQENQAQYQSVSASESILKVLGVSVTQDDLEPRFIRVFLSILNKAAVKANVNFDVSIG